MAKANFLLVVVWMGVRSIRRTYSAARAPPRFTFTRNFVFFMGSLWLGRFSATLRQMGVRETSPQPNQERSRKFPLKDLLTCKEKTGKGRRNA
jgi:hypothetical protein